MLEYFGLLVMTILGSFASLFLKRASGAEGIKNILLNKNFIIGGLLYFLSAIINIWILRYLDYSVVLPLTSLTYVWTMIISYWFLNERITIRKISGLSLVFVGAVLISISV